MVQDVRASKSQIRLTSNAKTIFPEPVIQQEKAKLEQQLTIKES